MPVPQFLFPNLKRRMAKVAIGPSTARGMGPAGMIAVVREYLSEIDLQQIADPDNFQDNLNECTAGLIMTMNLLGEGVGTWGAARKFLNIFLRDCLYNSDLSHHYNIAALEDELEVPLDRHVAENIRNNPEGHDLPLWHGVVHLEPDVSQQYQNVASIIAAGNDIARVHLDLMFWPA